MTPRLARLLADYSFAAEVIEAFLKMGICPAGYDRDDLYAFASRLADAAAPPTGGVDGD